MIFVNSLGKLAMALQNKTQENLADYILSNVLIAFDRVLNYFFMPRQALFLICF